MEGSTQTPEGVNAKNENTPDRVVWGAKAISQIIDRTERQTHHMLGRGLIVSATKKGGRWCAGATALRREFGI